MSLQLAMDVKQFTGFFSMAVYFIIADLGVGLQQLNNGIHPNFTFTFRAGPPSLTRTHSL